MTEPAWGLDDVIEHLDKIAVYLSERNALAWLRKLKDQRERLREMILRSLTPYPEEWSEEARALIKETE